MASEAAKLADELEKAFETVSFTDRADEGPCCARCGCSVSVRGDDEWEEGWWCHNCNGDVIGRIKHALPRILSALRTTAAGEAAWAECAHIRNVEAMMLEGQSDPVTMAYADAVAEIPKVRARTDAARKDAGRE